MLDISTGRLGPEGGRLGPKGGRIQANPESSPQAAKSASGRDPSNSAALLREAHADPGAPQHRGNEKREKERENKPCYRVWELFFTARLSQEKFIISWRCGFSSPLNGTTDALLSL